VRSINNNRFIYVTFGLLLLLVITLAGALLTSTMWMHVLIQIPLLVFAGVVIGNGFYPDIEPWLRRWNTMGVPGILLMGFTIVFWMIPRWLDYSIVDPVVTVAKYSTLVVFAGIPLAWSWERLHPIVRGFVKIELLSMLFRLGWLYMISPERFCNNYLLSDQIWLGRGLMVVAITLGITWLIPVFFGVAKAKTRLASVHVAC